MKTIYKNPQSVQYHIKILNLWNNFIQHLLYFISLLLIVGKKIFSTKDPEEKEDLKVKRG